MLFPVLILLAITIVLLVVLSLVVAKRPGDFKITRSTTIAAPADAIFAQVNDFHHWPAWSPWEKLDPAMQRHYSGAPAGPGASYSWDGNKKAGAGRLTITDTRPGEFIGLKLEFHRPFPATNTVAFKFIPTGDQTLVTWTMTGTNDAFTFKLMTLLLSMEKMVGPDFERGLAQLKTLLEITPQK